MLRTPPRPRLAPRAFLLAIVAGLLLTTGLGPVGRATTVSAGTAETMESQLLTLINNSRMARGLVPLRVHWALVDLSGDRAATMAATNTLSHTVAGCLSCQLASRGIQHYSDAEAIGETSWPWGSEAVTSLFNAYKGSATHWSLLMSSTYNYVGIGVAYNATYKTTYNSIILTEAVDQSRPVARMLSVSLSGMAITWSWTGADTVLQTHTAGLRNFDVQYRADSGSWTTLRSGTTARSLVLAVNGHGHWYGLRVLPRDNRDIVGYLTAELHIWVP